MAALMTSVMGDAKLIARYIRNCGDMGIDVLPPSVNKSQKRFSVEDGKIRFGLLGVKNVGENVIEAILAARKEKGEPSDIFSFISNLDISQVNKRAVESLIKAGACDCLEGNRAAKLAVYESLVESAQNSSKKNLQGQISLFQTASELMSGADMGERLPDISPFPKNIELAMEKEMLGVYLTDHPLNEYKDTMRRLSTLTSDDLAHIEEEMRTDAEGEPSGEVNFLSESKNRTAQDSNGTAIYDGMPCTMCGMLAAKKTLVTKSSRMMAFIDLEDLYGITEVVVFPNVYESCAAELQEDRVVAVRGTLNFKEDEAPKLLAEELLDIETASERGFSRSRQSRSYRSGISAGAGNAGSTSSMGSISSGGSAEQLIKLRIPEDMDEAMTLEEIKLNLRRHKGECDILIYLPSGKAFRAEASLRAEPTEELRRQMAAILGPENVKF